jgi:hypothetical protein
VAHEVVLTETLVETLEQFETDDTERIIRLPLAVPRVEGFSEFLQNALTGLIM